VAFTSRSTNLAGSDTNASADVYLRDMVNGTNIRVSSVVPGNNEILGDSGVTSFNCNTIAITDDGRKVAYVSANSAVVAADPAPSTDDIIFYDPDATLGAISTAVTTGGLANGNSTCVAMDGTGTRIAFATKGIFTSPDTNGESDIYLKDLAAGTYILVTSAASTPNSATGASLAPSMSTDGKRVVFASQAPDLITSDTNAKQDIFLYEEGVTGLRRISEAVSLNGTPQEPNGNSFFPQISGNGKFVVFLSGAMNLVDNDLNSAVDVFVRDIDLQQTFLVSVKKDGSQLNTDSSGPVSISSDGRFVSFATAAPGVVSSPAISGVRTQVYLKDRQTGDVFLLSGPLDGTAEGNQGSYSGVISKDGLTVTFESMATNLGGGTFSKRQIYQSKLQSQGGGGGDDGGGGDGGGSTDPIELVRKIVIADGPELDFDEGERALTIILREFFYRGKSAGTRQAGIARILEEYNKSQAARKKPKVQIVYEVTIRNTARRKTIKKTTKKNILTVRKLPPGDYAVSYNVRAVRGEKILAKSKQSPVTTVTIDPS
jgi:Tol biopolymer transport system component